MACANCGGEIKFPVMHGMRKLCSQQCREMLIERERVFVAPKRLELRQSLQRSVRQCFCPQMSNMLARLRKLPMPAL